MEIGVLFCALTSGKKQAIPFAILASVLAAFSCTAAELLTSNKYETVTVPVKIAAVFPILGALIRLPSSLEEGRRLRERQFITLESKKSE